MSETSREATELVPIDEAARRFGIKASTIRYYEERGLLDPVSRHSGRRWYGPDELRRLAVIRYWQAAGLMRLDQIANILAGSDGTSQWRQLIDQQLRTLQARIERMQTARSFLEHVASHHDRAPDGCPHYEALIWGQVPPPGHQPQDRPSDDSPERYRHDPQPGHDPSFGPQRAAGPVRQLGR
jgi:MerR family transcriptional regulator, copper efflux regulator